jgi:glycogen debranching enzyme
VNRWREQTGKLIDAIPLRNGLVWSDPNTTWMDTQWNDDGRAGWRIEIQALFLALCDAHTYLCMLTKTPVSAARREKSDTVIRNVHDRLVVENRLVDGLHPDGSADLTVRPNIFLAWYAAPKLFTNVEWSRFFSAVLPDLWLEWGGLSTISVKDRNFHAHSTGESNASYHRGDSWYFVNNIAAIAMRSVNLEQFKAYVPKIIAASTHDLLAQGYVGHCSEISSASRQEPFGCHAQAWSASTFLELVQEAF